MVASPLSGAFPVTMTGRHVAVLDGYHAVCVRVEAAPVLDTRGTRTYHRRAVPAQP